MLDIQGESDQYTTGDVTIVSSDRWLFRIPGHVLAWASPVFADIVALSTADSSVKLELTNDFEGKQTVHDFLELISTQTFGGVDFRQTYFGVWIERLHPLIHFLDKWDSERSVELLRSFGGACIMRGELFRENAFVFCAILNDLAMCREVIVRFGEYFADDSDSLADNSEDLEPLLVAKGGLCIELAGASYEFAGALPQAYQFALIRAARIHNPRDADKLESMRTRSSRLRLLRSCLETDLVPAFPNIIREPVRKRIE